MQKALLATAVALSLSALSFTAAAASSGSFVRVEAGTARYDVDNMLYDGKASRVVGLTAGYRWQLSAPFALGVEMGHVNLGKVKHRDEGSFHDGHGGTQPYTVRGELGMRTYLAGANARWQVTPGISLVGRLGVAHARTRLWTREDAGAYSQTFRTALTRNTMYAGLGLAYAVTADIDVGINLTHYTSTGMGFAASAGKVKVNTVGASTEVRF
ncbi:outer membrane beta-barrel protein [Luteibacter yeojuensis]